MKKLMPLLVLVLIISAIFVGCVNQEPTELTETSKDIENPNQQTNQGEDKVEFVEIKGKIAMVTEDITLKKPYVITVNSDESKDREELSEDKNYSLKKMIL